MTDFAAPFTGVYRAELEALIGYGDQVGPRGQGTKERIAAAFRCNPGYPLTDRPGWSERFALTETAQVILGRGDMRQLRALAPRFEEMAPSYVTYGPRIAWQLQHRVSMLQADPASRQAVVQVHEPGDAGKGYPEDPCTLDLQFLARGGRLHLIATMRSNDIWLGTTTDVYMFTLLQREMAAVLGLELGFYHHQAASLHIYDHRMEAAEAYLAGPASTGSPLPRGSLGCSSWEGVRASAKAFLDGEEVLPWSQWLG